MKVVFMGTPQFAVPTLTALMRSKHEVCLVVTGPDKRAGRSLKVTTTPVKRMAEELELPILQPIDFKNPDFLAQLSEASPDLCVVVAFKILPLAVLEIPKFGCVNLHPSMLPDLRGAAPINWALMNGYTSTGMTTFLIEKRVDAGGILIQEPVEIQPEDDAGSLSERLSKNGADLIVRTIDLLEKCSITPCKQNGSVTKAPKITIEMCELDWSKTAQQLHNQIRGLSPTPSAFTHIKKKRLKIYKSVVVDSDYQGEPGEIIGFENDVLIVATGSGKLGIMDLQVEGKRRMTSSEFQRGAHNIIGTKFA
ncbi:MAG: methionyl-tRNA formyltransferase [Calditrichaeota bacterium]|nr:methionyl-tRNA formyltransferase [Calditrichota bacterium]